MGETCAEQGLEPPAGADLIDAFYLNARNFALIHEEYIRMTELREAKRRRLPT